MKILMIIIFTILSFPVLSQDFHFSNLSSTFQYTNPAFIGNLPFPQFSATYRNQWPALSSTFVTYCASYAHPVQKMNSSFGLNIIQDVQGRGAIGQTSFDGIYAYLLQVSKAISVSAGLRLSYNMRYINMDRLVFESDLTGNQNGSDYMGLEDLRTGFADFSIGLMSTLNNNFYTGISVHHITNPVKNQVDQETGGIAIRYVLHLGGKLPVRSYGNDNISLLPGLQFQMQGDYNEILYGTNFLIQPFEIGLWTRHNIHFNLDAFILLLGFSKSNYNIYYSYDVNMKNINFFSPGMGAHEVTFLIKFQYKEKRKYMRAIKCPKI